MTWQELGNGIFRRRYERLDQNIGLVIGDDGACVIDSRSNHADADELREELRSVTAAPVRWLVNTHMHWDHTFGNARFPEALIVGHHRCRTALIEDGETVRGMLLDAEWIPDDDKPPFRDVVITPPVVTFDRELTLHLGDRAIELAFLGNGHTDNDIVVTVDEVCFAGDLVEEGAPPSFGDSFPSHWVETLDALIERLPSTVVPGHGEVVDPDFVRAQRDDIATALRAISGEDVGPPWSQAVMDSIRSRTRPRSGASPLR